MITADQWYDPDPDRRNIYQGDVMDGVPLVYTPGKNVRWVLLRPLPEGPLESARSGLPRTYRANVEKNLPTAWERPDGELVMSAAAIYRVAILSRSCSLDWKKHVEVAPVFPANELTEEVLNGVRENDDISRFYLPADGEAIPESYVDLDLKATVPISYVRRTDHLVRRLTSRATAELQSILSEYYAKPFGFNTKDKIPQKSIYRCASCFFEGVSAPVTRDLEPGDFFPPCERCGTRVLWVKTPDAQPTLFKADQSLVSEIAAKSE